MLFVCLTSPDTGPCHFQTQQGLWPPGRNVEIVQATGSHTKGASEPPRGLFRHRSQGSAPRAADSGCLE